MNLFKQIDILAPEYPGYGLYKGKTNASKLISDAQDVIDYATKTDGLNYSIENIIVVGRSLGTGVAVQLAAKYPALKAMILISAYTSIRDIAYSVAGSLSKIFIPNIFPNLETIKGIMVPALFIHGKKDELIPDTHAVKLFESCPSTKKRLEVRDAMDHNRCLIEKDIFEPIERFLTGDLQITDLKGLKLEFLNLANVTSDDNADDDSFELKKRPTYRFEKSPIGESATEDCRDSFSPSKFSLSSIELRKASSLK